MLQIILGKSGYGKTEFVFNKIKELVAQNESAVLITPEQFSFVAERRLLSELGEEKIDLVQSLSFSRLNDEIKRIYGGNRLSVLSKGSKAVMMQRAAMNVQDSLVLYGKNVSQASFISSFASVYDEMKSCRVDVDDILKASENAENDGKRILSDKLRDISTLISAYDKLIDNKYADCANELTRLYEILSQHDYFVGKTVLIDGFSGFVAQEYKILEVIIRQSKAVYLTLCNDNYVASYSDDLFYYVSKNFEILKEITENAGVRFLKPIYLDKNYRSNNEELKAIEANCFSRNVKQVSIESKNVKIYSAKNIYDECDHTSSEIVKLLRAGYKASDITVICRDLEKYKKELEFSFNKFNIPFYNDERQDISCQPIIMFASFLLRVGIYSRRSEDIFAMLKTGITGLDSISISALENYVFTWNISGSKWNKEFTGSTKGFVEEITENDKKEIEKLNVSREYIISRVNKFISSARNKSCKEICKAIYYALIDFSCDDGLRELAETLNDNGKSSLAEEQGKVWDLLMQILDKLAMIDDDKEITLKEFYKMFNLMITNEDLGSIPTGLDNIQIGSADRIRCDNPKVVFILGANEGAFPQAVSGHGLFTEADRITLINNNFKLYSYSEILNAQEKYFAYMAMTSASDKLYASYVLESEPSAIINQIKEVLPNTLIEIYNKNLSLDSIESVDNAFEILSSNFAENNELIASLNEYFSNLDGYSARLNAVNGLINDKDFEIKDKDVAKKLFKENMNLSASRIDVFYDCRFKYFCKFGLGANPRTKAEINPMQTGTVIHYVLEQVIKCYGKDGIVAMTETELENEIKRFLNSYIDGLASNSEEFTPRLKYQFMRLAKILSRVLLRIREEMLHSDFEPKAFELKIGDGSEDAPVKSKVLELPDGGSIAIRGSIDRVDTFYDGNKQYVRVVDYKTGSKTFNLNHIMYGINLQMFIYLFTLCESNHELSGVNAGVLYLRSGRNVFSYTSKDENSKISSDEDKQYKMLGLVLNDDENPIAEHMEHELAGKFIPVQRKKDELKGDIASLEELGKISKKIDSLLIEMGTDLHNGKINQNPIKISSHTYPCDYCDYVDVCKNKAEITPNVAEKCSSAGVLSALNEEGSNGKA